jgi:hypothetical protein
MHGDGVVEFTRMETPVEKITDLFVHWKTIETVGKGRKKRGRGGLEKGIGANGGTW